MMAEVLRGISRITKRLSIGAMIRNEQRKRMALVEGCP